MKFHKFSLIYFLTENGKSPSKFKGFSENQKIRRRALRILGVPEIDLVLDALGAGKVFEFLKCQEHSEGLAIGVGRIEIDKGEAEAAADFSC